MSVRTSAYRHGTTSTANLPTTSGVRGRQGGESVVLEQSFLSDIVAAEQQTPLPPPSGPGPPEQEAATAIGRRFAAVTAVISRWLATNPYGMLQELLDQPAEQMPIFRRAVGPVMVMRHEHVLRCLERTDLFTVDPYAPEMARATDDRDPTAYRHFLLGTDRDELYRLDDLILRRVVTRDDEATVAALARAEAERRASPVGGEIDVAATVAKYVPLRIVGDYLGVPHQEIGEPSPLPGLCGGDPFPLDDDLARRFSFTHIEKGRVPTADDLYGWIKDAFRNIFNNPRRPAARRLPQAGGRRERVPHGLRARTAADRPAAAGPRGGRAGHDADPPAPPAGRQPGRGVRRGFAPRRPCRPRGRSPGACPTR